MTRTQLKGLSTTALVAHARKTAEPLFTDGDLILELADRLDDVYPFVSNPQPDPEQQELHS